MIVSGSGPLLILTTYPEAGDPHLKSKLSSRGIEHYLAYEIDPAVAAERYTTTWDAVAKDLGTVEDIRVLDFNGHQIMANFALSELGEPTKA